ncbi:hypothetical protein TNCV_4932581 [Trichonephila clavipes]|nr:hypothetical protein TNCV_4932581 [Trichonephila clavipes]
MYNSNIGSRIRKRTRSCLPNWDCGENISSVLPVVYPSQHSACFLQELGKMYKVPDKMSNHKHMEDAMRWRIVGRLDADQSQAQMATELNVTLMVTCNISGNSFRTLDPY